MHILRRLVLRCPAHEYGTITERTGLKDILCDVIVSKGEKERGREGEKERGREGEREREREEREGEREREV